MALLLTAGTARAETPLPEQAHPLVPPQSLVTPTPATGGLGPTLRLSEPGPLDLPMVSGPLQWPGEAPIQPPAASFTPATAHGRPGPRPVADTPAFTGTAPAVAPPAAGSTGPPPEGAAADPRRQLVLDRQHRLLLVLDNGQERHRYPVAVGMPGWETPVGRFEVIEKTANPVWEHPATGLKIKPGPDNPLGSRWIGFHRDCRGRKGFNGLEQLELKGCVIAGFHGTPNRSSIGRAVSHGCVRLYDENVQELFDLVRIGTPVTVLP